MYKNVRVSVWDLGGQHAHRALWRYHFQGSKGLLFAVDSSDRLRMHEAKREHTHALSTHLGHMHVLPHGCTHLDARSHTIACQRRPVVRVGAVVAEARFPKAKRFPHELTAARPPRARHHSQECPGSPCILRGPGERGDARARLPDCLSVRQTVLTPPPSLVSVPDGMYRC